MNHNITIGIEPPDYDAMSSVGEIITDWQGNNNN